MDNLSKEQFMVLKRINKLKHIRNTDIDCDSDKEILLSLIQKNLVEIEWLFDTKPLIDNKLNFPDDTFPPEYKITQTGKAYIQSKKSSTIKWWIPNLISFTALIVSIIAITTK